ncbi:hypothetical protein [Nocardia sp. NPDC003963]
MWPVTMMDDAAERLVAATATVVRDVHRRVEAFSDCSGGGARLLGAADRPVPDQSTMHLPGDFPAPRSAPRRGIVGTDLSTGKDVEIDPADIVSTGLRDADGRPIGVSFPLSDNDERIVAWASMRHRTSDEYIRAAYYLPGRPPERPEFEYGPLTDAAWAKEVRRTGVPPVYVFAHSNQAGYGLQVRATGGVPRKMLLEGGSYGQAVELSRDSVRAYSENEFNSMVHVSCGASRPGNATGQLAADHLIERADMYRNIHVPRSVIEYTSDPDSSTSWLNAVAVIDSIGSRHPDFDTFWGSPYAELDMP